MKITRFSFPLTVFLLGGPVLAQQHEIGLTLGGVFGSSRRAPSGSLDLRRGVALQANYGYRIWGSGESPAALYIEGHFLSSPLRDIKTANTGATRDFATLYVAPGLRVKFAPSSRVSPYVAAGGGYALYEQSTTTIGGGVNAAPRHIHRGAFHFGGGVDYRVLPWLAFRGEVRDFYTGSPAFGAPVAGGQHNVVASGGFVLRFR